MVYQTQLVATHFDGTLNYLNPMAYASTLSDNETYTFKEMLQQPDKNDFIMAMIKEIQDHENREHWSLFPRADIPDGHKTFLAIIRCVPLFKNIAKAVDLCLFLRGAVNV